jgi:hypothetical protein
VAVRRATTTDDFRLRLRAYEAAPVTASLDCTAAGPSSAVQCLLSGGLYTTASHVLQCQLVPATAVSEAGDVADEDLVRAEEVSIRWGIGSMGG